MVRHLEPNVHVESVGGKVPEKDSAMDRLWQHVPRMIRVVKTTKSSTESRKSVEEPEAPAWDAPGNIESVDNLVNSSLAKEIGFGGSSW
jgi:hypothetical protein